MSVATLWVQVPSFPLVRKILRKEEQVGILYDMMLKVERTKRLEAHLKVRKTLIKTLSTEMLKENTIKSETQLGRVPKWS